MTNVYSFVKKIPVTLLGRENPVPFFRDFPAHQSVDIEKNTERAVSKEISDSMGLNTAKCILPYKEQSNYLTESIDTDVLHVCIENEKLKATLLPEWGGRLISLYDKNNNTELLYNPEQIILKNLAIRNAWFAGGIEWNIGYYGHTSHTTSPVYCGSVNLGNRNCIRIFNFEKISKLWWQVDFILEEESAVLEVSVSVYNDENVSKDLYWWTNIAVLEEQEKRVLSSNNKSLWRSDVSGGFKYVDFPFPDKSKKIDFSYSTNYPNASEFFFCKPNNNSFPWIATIDNKGNGFFETSTDELLYRKMFCWGKHQGGENWQKLLRENGGADYLEIQAGIAPTQLHYANITAKSVVSWTHYIGALDTNIEKISKEKNTWNEISSYVESQIKCMITNKTIPNYKRMSEQNISKIFLSGEYVKNIDSNIDVHTILPQYLLNIIDNEYEKYKISKEKKRWINLLLKNEWDSYENEENIEWYLDERYENIFKAQLKSNKIDWSIYLHLGVMAREKFNFELAQNYFKLSLQHKKNQFSYWGLIDIFKLYRNYLQMRYWISESIKTISIFELKIELLRLCSEFSFWDEFYKIWNNLTITEQGDPRLYMEKIKELLYQGDMKQAKDLFLQGNPLIREGNIEFKYIWEKIDGNLKNIPPHLDYRMNPFI